MAGNRKRAAILALALGAAAPLHAGPALAQSVHAGSLDVPLNKSQVVSADRPIAKALVGNADIADVLPITDRSIYVLGKKMGTTSLTLYDGAGRVLSIMDIAVGPDVIALGDQLRQIVPDEKIDARISNKSIVLTGMVNTAGAADRAAQLAKAFIDPEGGGSVINLIGMGSSQQVMLEVRFAEVTRNNGKDIGVKLNARSRDGTFNGVSGQNSSFTPGSITGTTVTRSGTTNGTSNNASGSLSGNLLGQASREIKTINGATTITDRLFGSGEVAANGIFSGSASSGTSGSTDLTSTAISSILGLGALSEGFGIFSKTFRLGNVNIEGILNAMETRGLAKTLAQPTLIALSGEKASFLAGGEFPVPVNQTGTGGGSSITVEFKPFGISLAFTPTVLGDRTINLVVEPEVSAIDPQASLRLGDLVIPGLRTRRANTTLELRDGESFAIAGLLSKEFETTVEQIPLLGSIPILGALFRSSGFRKGETELLIVVTPRLVQPVRPEQIRLPTDRVLDPREGDTFLLGQSYRPTKLDPVAPAPPAPQSAAPQNTSGPAATKEDGYAY